MVFFRACCYCNDNNGKHLHLLFYCFTSGRTMFTHRTNKNCRGVEFLLYIFVFSECFVRFISMPLFIILHNIYSAPPTAIHPETPFKFDGFPERTLDRNMRRICVCKGRIITFTQDWINIRTHNRSSRQFQGLLSIFQAERQKFGRDFPLNKHSEHSWRSKCCRGQPVSIVLWYRQTRLTE